MNTRYDSSENHDLLKRTKEFAYACIRIAASVIKNDPLGQIASRQLIRCGTSVAANYRAAFIAPSRKSFGAKLSICAEEADESAFWLDVIRDHSLSKLNIDNSYKEAIELKRIFIASRKKIALSS